MGIDRHDPFSGDSRRPQPGLSDPGRETEKHIMDSMGKHPADLDSVRNELQHLKQSESAAAYKRDFEQINRDLTDKKILPDLKISPEFRSVLPEDNKSGKPEQRHEKGSQKEHNSDKGHTHGEPAPQRHEGKRPEKHDKGHEHGRSHDHGHHPHGRHHGHHHGHRHGHHHHHHHRHRHGHGHGDASAGKGSDKKFEDGAYDGIKAPSQDTIMSSVKTVLAEAKAQGLSPNATRAAVAAMLLESKGDPHARGDGGTSVGLFQLHKGGELTEALKNGTLKNESEALDPLKNAHVALAYFKKIDEKGGFDKDPGEGAAAAQRPRHSDEYAKALDRMLKQADDYINKARAA